MKKTGYTDLPLHYGTVPRWLSNRMADLVRLITEAIVHNQGKDEFLTRLSDPLWFQSFGAVLGMDWHSSGITTSVLYALKRGINPISKELGIYICGGRGKYSRQTPDEILQVADKTGLDGNMLVKASRLSAKIDSTAVQDGFNLYLHNFILTDSGQWAVIQQGMNPNSKSARRYHWHSKDLKNFTCEPHTGVTGENQGLILNLTDKNADITKKSIINITGEKTELIMNEIKKIKMPSHHEVREKDINLKRLGAVLATAYNHKINNFTSLLLINGLGPRTLQSLVLVSEIIYGTPSRFNDPARFSFAHGGKDGHPFPVPLKIYDKSINVLRDAINKSKIGNNDKLNCLKRLYNIYTTIEKLYNPKANFNRIIEKEKKESKQYGGKTVFD